MASAIEALGQGFLEHPANDALRAQLGDGALSPDHYFNELVRVAFRIAFSLVVERRGLDAPGGLGAATISHVVAAANNEGDGAWEEAKCTLFAVPDSTDPFPNAAESSLSNAALHSATNLIAAARDWKHVAPEEFGAPLEALLKLKPVVDSRGSRFTLATSPTKTKSQRKATGTYLTGETLAEALVDSSLQALVADTIEAHRDAPVEALLRLRIVDPACGPGNLLLAAARRLAWQIADLRGHGSIHLPEYRQALRVVVAQCVFGVDLNPTAVDLARMCLWLEAAEPGVVFAFPAEHVQKGNALIGAPPHLPTEIPDDAWQAVVGDDKLVSAALRKRNRAGRRSRGSAPDPRHSPGADPSVLADIWCAAFFWPAQPGRAANAAPTTEVWRPVVLGQQQPQLATLEIATELAVQHSLFHWHLAFPEVFAAGGFDVVLGNPPWIAYAGRATQPLPPRAKRYFKATQPSFSGYPTAHGMFIATAARIARLGGRIGLLVPSSVSELDGYEATRTCHDAECAFDVELDDFGDGQFEDVTAPCMIVASERTPGGRTDANGGSLWPVRRPDLTAVDRALLAKIATLPTLPPGLFGERGFRSNKASKKHISKTSVPSGRFTLPIREGKDVREFELLPPHLHMDAASCTGQLRSPKEYAAVKLLVRQVARYPIAAASDGGAFRNTCLAVLEHPVWDALGLLALLNSSFIRWAHYQRFLDARQVDMPQVKIAHLRATPIPSSGFGRAWPRLVRFGAHLSSVPGDVDARKKLDELVARAFGLTPAERILVAEWHDRFKPSSAAGAVGAATR